eukprot:SAG11_NODE_852_length_6874_cov_2.914391_2_plen_1844_part_00
MASEIYFGLKELGFSCWLDVKMTKCDVDAMEEGVRQSRWFIAIVTNNGKDSYFSRPMCRDEIRWALDAGKPIVPVNAVEDKPRVGEFIAEANAHDLGLIGSFNFVSIDRQGPRYFKASLKTLRDQHSVQAHRGGCSPDVSRHSSAAAAATAVTRHFYLHVALQLPPMAIGEKRARAELHARVGELEARLITDRENWVDEMQYPLCLSDASSAVCKLEAHLRMGAVYGLLWCGKGYGWEQRLCTGGETSRFMPSIDSLIEVVRQDENPAPVLAVICLEYGACRAADDLVAAGIRTVLWLEISMLGDSCVGILCNIIAPVLRSMHSGAELATSDKQLKALLREKYDSAALGGCIGESPAAWDPPDGSAQHWHRNLLPDSANLLPDTPTLNLRRHMSGPCICSQCLQVVAGDLGLLSEIQVRLLRAANAQRLIIVSPMVPAAISRRRAVALELCVASPGRSWRISTVDEMCNAAAAALATPPTATPSLVWLDLFQATAPDLAQIEQRWHEGLESGSFVNTHLLVTCEDAYSEAAVEQFEEGMELNEEIIEQFTSDSSNVHADELHEEFKLSAKFKSDAGSSRSLLDVFEPELLAATMQEQMGSRPILALYHSSNDMTAVFVRICISDVGFLHELRDNLLTGKFTSKLAASLQKPNVLRKAGCDSLGAFSISVDKTQFARQYESSILRLTKLTNHQRNALSRCASDSNLHIKAAAGAGKTFVALHFMLEQLQASSDARVLFIAKNMALAVFVSKWLAHRVELTSDVKRRKLLRRMHLLFAPMDDGPREVKLDRRTMQTAPTAALPSYDLIVVDEAHHIYSDESLRSMVEGYIGSRRLLLSDISQGMHNATRYPVMADLMLTEVVRSSKRIVAGAMRFQMLGKDKLLTKCHHDSEGPPLQSFLFDVEKEANRFEQYAAQTATAIRHVGSEFPGLSLHDRLAIVVPDASWRDRLQPLLERQLTAGLPDRSFRIVNAAAACADCAFGSHVQPEHEWLLLDGVAQVDGLERLIVVCVGLDAPLDDASAIMLEARSMLYRAITRAHMAVLVVNEYLPKGWFGFLTGVKLREDRSFNVIETASAANVEFVATDRTVAEAAARRQLFEEQASAALKAHGSFDDSTEAQVFLRRHIMAAMEKQQQKVELLVNMGGMQLCDVLHTTGALHEVGIKETAYTVAFERHVAALRRKCRKIQYNVTARMLKSWLLAIMIEERVATAMCDAGFDALEDLQKLVEEPGLLKQFSLRHFEVQRLLRLAPGAMSIGKAGAVEAGHKAMVVDGHEGLDVTAWLEQCGLVANAERLVKVSGLQLCDVPHTTAADLRSVGVANADYAVVFGRHAAVLKSTALRSASLPTPAGVLKSWLLAIMIEERVATAMCDAGFDALEDLQKLVEEPGLLKQFSLRHFEVQRLLRLAPGAMSIGKAGAVEAGHKAMVVDGHEGLDVTTWMLQCCANDAIAESLRDWEQQQLLRRIPVAVVEAASDGGITDPVAVKSLQEVASAKLRTGGTLEAAVASAMAERERAGTELAILVETHELIISNDKTSGLLNSVAGKFAAGNLEGKFAVRDALVSIMLSEAAKQQQLRLGYWAQRSLHQFVDVSTFTRKQPMKTSVVLALGRYTHIQTALVAEAHSRQIDTIAAHGWVDAGQLLGKARDTWFSADTWSPAALKRTVSEAVDRWQQDDLKRQDLARRQNLVTQSIWDPSTNTCKPAPAGGVHGEQGLPSVPSLPLGEAAVLGATYSPALKPGVSRPAGLVHGEQGLPSVPSAGSAASDYGTERLLELEPEVGGPPPPPLPVGGEAAGYMTCLDRPYVQMEIRDAVRRPPLAPCAAPPLAPCAAEGGRAGRRLRMAARS